MMQPISRCPVCRGRLIKEKDNEGRLWAKCIGCGARFPLESGFREIFRGKEVKDEIEKV